MKRLRFGRPKLTRRRLVFLAAVATLGGGTAFGWRVWQTSRPEYHWVAAQAALAAQQPAAAKLELQNLLQDLPQHGPGHHALAQLLLAEAKAARRAVTIAEVAPALTHLIRAAECLPQDVRLQKQVLTLLLETKRLREAAEVAERIKLPESGNPDVLYALTWRAVDGYRQANAEMTRLSGLSRSPFQALVLQIEFQHTLEHEAHVQAALDAALAKAESAAVDELYALTPREYESLLKLCRWSVERAGEQAAAEARANRAVGILARMGTVAPADDARRRRLAEAAETADHLLLKLQARYPTALAAAKPSPAAADFDEAAEATDDCSPAQSPAEGAADACADAPEAASAAPTGEADRPVAPSPPVPASLVEQVEQLRRAAVAAEAAAPLAYYQSAAAAFAQGDDDAGLDILRRGLKSGDLLPAARQRELLDLRFMLARKLIDLQRYAEADEQITALEADADARGWAEWLRGMTALKQGRGERAHHAFQLARISLGNILPVRWGLLHALTMAEKFDTAQAELQAIEAHLAALTPEQSRCESGWVAAHELDLVRLRIHLGLKDAQAVPSDLTRLVGTPAELAGVVDAVKFYVRNDRTDDALALLRDVRTRLPGELRPAELTVDTLLRAGRAAEAERFIAEFTAAAPDDFRRKLLRGRWLLTQRRTEELARWIGEMETEYAPAAPERREISFLKAWGKLQAGDTAGAREAAEPLRADPNYSALAVMLTASIDLRAGNPAEAAKLLAELRTASPESISLGLWQARLAAAQGNFAAAVDLAAESLELTAVRQEARQLLIDFICGWSQSASPAAAQEKLDTLVAARPREAVLGELQELAAALARADEAFRLGRTDACLAALDAVAPSLPATSPWVPLLKARACLKSGGYERAVAEADLALQRAPLYVPALVAAAEARLQLGRTTEALDLATTALGEQPQSAPAALCRAEALRRLRRMREAVATLESLAEKKFDAATSLRVAVLHQACEAPAPARAWGRKAQEAAATPAERQRAEMFLANLALGAGLQTEDAAQLAEARNLFAAVFAADPQQEVAGNNLAWLLAERFQQPAEAVKIAEQVRGDRAIERLAPDFIDTLITAYRRAERIDDALAVAAEAAAARPQDAGLRLQLGNLLAAQGRADEARRALEAALDLGLAPPQADAARRTLSTLAAPTTTTK